MRNLISSLPTFELKRHHILMTLLVLFAGAVAAGKLGYNFDASKLFQGGGGKIETVKCEVPFKSSKAPKLPGLLDDVRSVVQTAYLETLNNILALNDQEGSSLQGNKYYDWFIEAVKDAKNTPNPYTDDIGTNINNAFAGITEFRKTSVIPVSQRIFDSIDITSLNELNVKGAVDETCESRFKSIHVLTIGGNINFYNIVRAAVGALREIINITKDAVTNDTKETTDAAEKAKEKEKKDRDQFVNEIEDRLRKMVELNAKQGLASTVLVATNLEEFKAYDIDPSTILAVVITEVAVGKGSPAPAATPPGATTDSTTIPTALPTPASTIPEEKLGATKKFNSDEGVRNADLKLLAIEMRQIRLKLNPNSTIYENDPTLRKKHSDDYKALLAKKRILEQLP